MEKQFIDIISRFISFSSIYLSDDVYERLEKLQKDETSPRSRNVYAAMFNNINMAEKLKRPICQDTGLIQFYIEVGANFPYLSVLESALKEAVINATITTPLRPNIIECFDEQNTGNNTGTLIPWIDQKIIPGSDKLRLFIYLAGGGCSLPGFARVFTPMEGYQAAIKAVFDQIVYYGINACPPLLVGLGFGGQIDAAAKLSKQALFRFIGERNPNAKIAHLEKILEANMNKIGLGPGGLGGNNSIMSVHIEQSGRHLASIAVALSVACWAHRRSLMEIQSDLNYKILSHKRLGEDHIKNIFTEK